MRDLGLEGARRGKKIRTTIRDDGQERAGDLLRRDFTAASGADARLASSQSTTPGSPCVVDDHDVHAHTRRRGTAALRLRR